jgi:hypothetical protein
MNHEKAHIYRVQMEQGPSGTFDGKQTLLECEASLSTFLYPLLNTSNSPLMTFGDCAIQRGNSGSPIFNHAGELGAIVQGYLALRSDDLALKNELEPLLLDGVYGQVGVGTQLRCVAELNPISSVGCESVISDLSFHAGEYLDRDSGFDLGQLPRLASEQEWIELSRKVEYRAGFSSHPKCFRGESFESNEMDYRRGINRFFQSEWRSQTEFGEKKETFSAMTEVMSGQKIYSSSAGEVIQIPSCR